MSYCTNHCPCQAGCPNGCSDCVSSFCQCQTPDSSPDYLTCKERVDFDKSWKDHSKKLTHQKAYYDQFYTACILSCPIADTMCVAECARAYNDNMVKCPCEEGCPNGCPCPDYICPRPENTDVLILNQWYPDNPAVITNAVGKDDRSINFQFGENTEVMRSCSITWRNEYFIFGGSNLSTQISKVVGCQLKNIGKLTFEHMFGGCATVGDNAIYLCFGENPYKMCRILKSPTGQVDEVIESMYDHSITRIAASTGKLLKTFQSKSIHIVNPRKPSCGWLWKFAQKSWDFEF